WRRASCTAVGWGRSRGGGGLNCDAVVISEVMEILYHTCLLLRTVIPMKYRARLLELYKRLSPVHWSASLKVRYNFQDWSPRGCPSDHSIGRSVHFPLRLPTSGRSHGPAHSGRRWMERPSIAQQSLRLPAPGSGIGVG